MRELLVWWSVKFQYVEQLEKLEFEEVIKMIDINDWMKNFLQKLDETFANRVWFVGLCKCQYKNAQKVENKNVQLST